MIALFICFLLAVCLGVLIYVVLKRIPIYIVSLERRPERGKFIMDRIGFSWKYYVAKKHAVDGKEKFVEPFISRSGEAGCFLSHIYMWNLFIKSRRPYALILEDDADIKLPEQWNIIENAVRNVPADWDIIWLGVNKMINPERNVKVNEEIYRLGSEVWGTHAYLISRKCAKYLYDKYNKLEKYESVKDFSDIEPIDLLLSKSKDIKNYIISKSLIRQVQNRSDTWYKTS